jgi:hypothetical protein
MVKWHHNGINVTIIILEVARYSQPKQMESKKIFLKKAAPFCFLLMVFIFNSRSFSQIIYTDIPDATPNATYPLDLNNDTIVDFLIQFDLGDKVMCKPQNKNRSVVVRAVFFY